MRDQSCGACRHFDPDDKTEQDPSEQLGACRYLPRLPHSLRYCLRERVGVYADQGVTCQTFERGPGK